MTEHQLSRTASHPLSPLPDMTSALLGEDRCDIRHPIRAETSCALPVGHGAQHQCSTHEGERHEWA